MITVASYMESLLGGAEYFRTLRELYPVTDHRGQPVFSVSGTAIRFDVMHEGRPKSLICTLAPADGLSAADSDRILNTTNKNNPYIASCQVRRGEMLAFDTASAPRWNDVTLCDRPAGLPLPSFVRSRLNRSDRKPLRELLRNIAAMAASLAADNITHGNLKPENIYVSDDGLPCAVDFAAYAERKHANDGAALGLLALGVFLMGCESGLYTTLGGMEMFRPARFRANERHIRAQAEFSKLHPLTDLLDLLVKPYPTDWRNTISADCHPAVDHERLCKVLARLSATPFEPLPLLVGLSSASGSPEAPAIRSAQAGEQDVTAGRAEDVSMRVDFRRCEFVGDISDTLIRFRLDGRWGFADRYGRRLTEEEYLSAEDFYEGRARVETPSGCGLIDRAGDYVMPPVYEILEWLGADNVVTACREGRWELYDRSGRTLSAAPYDWIGGAAEGTLIVRRGDKFGYITTSGTSVTDIRYDEAYSFRNGEALVTAGEESYHIDRTGRKISPR